MAVCVCACVCLQRGKYGRNHNWWRDRAREMGWAYSSRPSLPRQNKPGEWKSSYQGDSRQIKGDCQEIIALVFKPWLAVSCHNKTGGGGGGGEGQLRGGGEERKERERRARWLFLVWFFHSWCMCFWKGRGGGGGGGDASGSSESAKQKERGEGKRELLICLACLLHATAVHLLWNGCIWKSAL